MSYRGKFFASAHTGWSFLFNFVNDYTCDKQVLWESAGAFFSARQLSNFTRQLGRFTRSWSSGKMLAFQPRGFVFEPVGMR